MQQSAVRNQQEDDQIAKSSIQEDNIQMQKRSGSNPTTGQRHITTKSPPNLSSSQVGRDMRMYAVLQEKYMR
jgi:hypothetical protein